MLHHGFGVLGGLAAAGGIASGIAGLEVDQNGNPWPLWALAIVLGVIAVVAVIGWWLTRSDEQASSTQSVSDSAGVIQAGGDVTVGGDLNIGVVPPPPSGEVTIAEPVGFHGISQDAVPDKISTAIYPPTANAGEAPSPLDGNPSQPAPPSGHAQPPPAGRIVANYEPGSSRQSRGRMPSLQFETVNSGRHRVPTERRVRALRFVSPVERVVRADELPVELPCGDGKLIIKAFEDDGVIVEEVNTSGVYVYAETFYADEAGD